ncbi:MULTISPECIES: transketolase family protein [unclassified Clostridioides]|uniref:transketolase family protein n=5 Tax=Clostridioides TaxID=1870884 RepID=UPI001D0FAE41|nr:transketolase family protein [Clostridioides sp. ZZV14-6150]MCC0720870.1 transketolase family protein [Clostridioides sp. ZZV14-6104]MCC0731146.1 transketolase family protein [Clostridioides sp. ZZV14-6048]MCC0733420.1 transketolase family protein [Clostridioides sp. ZZV14-6009]MCC0737046.1 transketolase family protein [Clostridioides sp. ZZV14-5902]MCC0741321.1 transketolase family protein [Clostridioides sp. ZZV14-6044]MCC0749502.1 transketolase family protein [Clostridioides sp. ZZV13-5
MGIATREAYGQVLKELAENKDIVVLDADLGKATKSISFKEVAPDRFFDMGIAEGDMIGTAAGLATCGKIPFASTFAIFAAGRGYEQIRNSVAYPNLNVKIAATHAGVTVGEDGGSHQAIEDISLMRGIPNMVILNPADGIEAKKAIFSAVNYNGPVYIRLGRATTEDIHNDDYNFKIGKGEILRQGSDVAIIATGIMVSKAIKSAELLSEEGIEAIVVNISTIKPIDSELIVEVAKNTGKVVTVEEHSVIGGLGSAVTEVLSEKYPVVVKRIGVNDEFGQSGNPESLLNYYGLTVENIVNTVKSF